MQPIDFFIPTRVIFGPGRVAELSSLLAPLHQRILIVTDRGVAEATEALDVVRQQLVSRQVSAFLEVESNPSLATAEQGGAFAREVQADLVIGLGGGSPMDVAKGVALLATNPGSLQELMAAGEPATAPLPVVCLPTTSGTGSEVTPFAVFTDPQGQSKGGYSSPTIFPVLSVIDPELTYSMPRAVVVDTGLDALTHAVEAFVSLDATPVSDLFALEATRIVRDHLGDAAQHQTDAMNQMALAATLAGVAIALAGTTLLHVMGYPLTIFHGLSHGRASACMLPQYLAFLAAEGTIPDRIARLEALLEPAGGPRALMEDLGVSTAIGDYGVVADEIPGMVEKVIVKDDLRITPATVGREQIARLYESSLGS